MKKSIMITFAFFALCTMVKGQIGGIVVTPAERPAIIGPVSKEPNLQINDAKRMESTIDYENAMIKMTFNSQRVPYPTTAISYNMISAAQDFGINSTAQLGYSATQHTFSTTSLSSAFIIASTGNLCVNNPSTANRTALLNMKLKGTANEDFVSITDNNKNYSLSFGNRGTATGSGYMPSVEGISNDATSALYLKGVQKGTSTGSRGIITFDGQRATGTVSATQTVFEFCSGLTNRLVHITGEGNLIVKSSIRATEVKVMAQPADFVFEDDYELRSLDEVNDFISANKHLPDIPSAAEMERDGIGLSEMNKLLLQKIEELTLYIINQEGRIKDLEKK